MKYVCILLTIFLVVEAGSPQSPSRLNDFAYGLPIELEAGGSIYEITLPRAIYEGVTQADLRDLRVFNGAGEVVPHLLRTPPLQHSGQTRIRLPLFPLYGDTNQLLQSISLNVKRDAAGTILNVQSRSGTPEKRLLAYLLDATTADRSIAALILDFGRETRNVILRISVDCSENLDTWSSLVRSTTLADLTYGDFSLRQNRISFNPTQAKYFRISSADGEVIPTLPAIAADLANQTIEPQREWQTLTAELKKSAPGEYHFTSAGYMPVDRLRLLLPQKNTIAQVVFWSRNADREEWRHRSSVLIYHLQIDEKEIVNPEEAVYSGGDPQWRMTVEQSGGGLGEGQPQLEIGWVPQQLLFVARGEGPFTLAYGNAREQAVEKQPEILSALKQQDAIGIKTAKTGARISLGGESRLRPPALGSDPKHWILWGTLILAVLLLGGMARRLLRQMSQETT